MGNNKIAQLRERAGLTQTDLAKKAGLHRTQIWKLEHDIIKPENLTLAAAARIAKALSIPKHKVRPEDLLENKDTE